MKRFWSIILCLTAFALQAENLLLDPSLTQKDGCWSNSAAISVLPGQAPDGGNSVLIGHGNNIKQSGLHLVAGEKYLLGGLVRTENFKTSVKDRPAFYVTTHRWTNGVYTPAFPANTNGQWVKIDRTVTMPVSDNGLYDFQIHLPKTSGKLEIAQVYLIPLSDKAKSDSLSAVHWSKGNLLLNPELSGDASELVSWSVGNGGSDAYSVALDKGIPGGRNCAVKIDLARCAQLYQNNIQLLAGEQYRIGGWVKTRNFSSPANARTAFYIHNTGWKKDVKTGPFPANTNGKWVYVSKDVTIPPSSDGRYTFTLWGAKSKGELEISHPFLIPISPKARKYSRPAIQGENLIRNPEFKGTADDLGIWNNNLNKISDPVTLLPGEGPGKRTALRIDLPRLVDFAQGGIKLVAGEKYKLGAWVRTENFKSSGSQLVISNYQWSIGVGTQKFPENTNGKWVRFEKEITAQKSRNGQYAFHIYGGKCSGKIEICNPYLIPLSEKAIAGSAPAEVWEKKLARVIPYHPMMKKIQAATGKLDLCVVYPVSGEYTDYLCRISHAVKDGNFGTPKTFEFTSAGLCHAEMGPLPAGEGKFRVEMVSKKDGKVILSNDYWMNAVIPLPKTGKQLNNFVTEIYRGDLENKDYQFTAWEDGWYRIAFSQAQKNATAKLDGAPVIEYRNNEFSETMRYIKAGKHTASVENSTPGAEIVIAKVPELPVFPFTVAEKMYYNNGKKILSGAFSCDMDFAKKYLWQNFNTYFVTHFWYPERDPMRKAADIEFKKRGIAMLACEGMPVEDWSNAQRMIENIRNSTPIQTTSGRCLDETGPNAAIDVLTALVEMGWHYQEFDKIIHTWMDAQYNPYFHNPAIHRPLVSALTNVSKGRGKLLMETYILSKPDEKSMEEYFEKFVRQITVIKKIIPDPQERLTYIIGNYQKFGVWNANCYPHIDMKYFMDRYLQLLSTHPECRELFGFGCYSIASGDEEMQRWIARLVRHYCIEGKTSLVSGEYGYKLIPGHLDNCDFQEGFKNWDVFPAEKDSLRPHKIFGLAKKYQCRRLHSSPYGDTCALFIRSSKAPNRISRKITGLTPGKKYSLTFVTADPDTFNGKNVVFGQDIAFNATLSDADIDRKLSYDMRAGGKQFQDIVVEIQTRKIIFTAKAAEVTVTFSDWKSDTEMGGSAGDKRVLNFIQVTPYFTEEN